MASIPLKRKDDRKDRGLTGFVEQWGVFLRQFLKHPGMIGSVIPSSAILVDRMLEDVDWHRTRLFVEYGPGVGTFTRTILDRLHPDATLLAIDVNPDFVAWIDSHFDDHRLKVVHGSAADVARFVAEAGHHQADYILSGIPFSTLPDGVPQAIVAATQAALRPGGAFLVYQYSARVRRYLTTVFDRIETRVEWRNIPPCRLFTACREEALARAA